MRVPHTPGQHLGFFFSAFVLCFSLLFATLYLSVLVSCSLVMAQQDSVHLISQHASKPDWLFRTYGWQITHWWLNRPAVNDLLIGFPLIIPPPLFLAVGTWRTVNLLSRLHDAFLPEEETVDDVTRYFEKLTDEERGFHEEV